MNAAHLPPRHGITTSIAPRVLQAKPGVASEPPESPPIDGVTLSPVESSPGRLGRGVANVVSLLAIGGAIACGAAGMVAAPAALVGVSLIGGWMATDRETPSKLTAWMDKRESHDTAPGVALGMAPGMESSLGNPRTLSVL